MLLYRVENLVDGKGLWYDSNTGEYTNLVHDLDLSNRFLPMDATQILSEQKWRSAAETVEQLKF